jgi:hypothetical protein
MSRYSNNFIGDYYAGPSPFASGLMSFGQALGQGFADRGDAIRQRELDQQAEARRQQEDVWKQTQMQWQTDDRNNQMLTRQTGGLLASGQLDGSMGQYGRTGEEMTTKFGYNPMEYLQPQDVALMEKRKADQAEMNLKARQRLATNAILSGNPQYIANYEQKIGVSPYVDADPAILSRMQEGQANRDLRAQMAADQASLRRDLQGSKSNLPAPAPGYIWGNAPDGSLIQIPVPGGPAAAKVEEKQGKEGRQQATRERQLNILSEDITRALSLSDQEMALGIPTVGAGSVFANLPGTKAHDLAKTLDSIKARVGFDALQEMRANSPTGGALGAVSEKENMLLQSQLGSLEQSQSKEAFKHNLQRLERTYLDIVHGPGNWEKYNSEIRLKNSGAGEQKKTLKYNPQTGGFD